MLPARRSRPRNDVSANNGAALDATLSQFVTEVRTLRSSGELSAAIAAGLERQAVATEARAAQQLRPAVQASDTVDVARRVPHAHSRESQTHPHTSAATATRQTTPPVPPPTPPASARTMPSAAPTSASSIDSHHRRSAYAHFSEAWHHANRGHWAGRRYHRGSAHWGAWNGGRNS
jgi:hypothetical protein